MSIPIVGKIEDAPEQGDCWLITQNDLICVRDRLRGWHVTSCGGWNAQARRMPYRFDDAIFAATAEEAIAQHCADREKCPFGKVTLERTPDTKGLIWQFSNGPEVENADQGWLVKFGEDISSSGHYFWQIQDWMAFGGSRAELAGLIKLLAQVRDFQSACAAGHPEQSAIGHWIKEQGGTNA